MHSSQHTRPVTSHERHTRPATGSRHHLRAIIRLRVHSSASRSARREPPQIVFHGGPPANHTAQHSHRTQSRPISEGETAARRQKQQNAGKNGSLSLVRGDGCDSAGVSVGGEGRSGCRRERAAVTAPLRLLSGCRSGERRHASRLEDRPRAPPLPTSKQLPAATLLAPREGHGSRGPENALYAY